MQQRDTDKSESVMILRITFLETFKVTLPIIAGLLPTARAYSLFVAANGIDGIYAILSNLLVFAGTVQFLSVELMVNNMGVARFALVIFLLHSRYIFYGVSVFEQFLGNRKTQAVYDFFILRRILRNFDRHRNPG